MSELQFPSEAFIEDYVFQYIADNRDCPISGECCHFALQQSRIGRYGVADIIKVYYDSDITITVLELKNAELKVEHFAQLARYMKGIEYLADKYRRRLKQCPKITVKGELAGIFDYSNVDVKFLMGELSHNISVFDLKATMDKGFYSESISSDWYIPMPNPFKIETRNIFDDVRDFIEDENNQKEFHKKAKLSAVNLVPDLGEVACIGTNET